MAGTADDFGLKTRKEIVVSIYSDVFGYGVYIRIACTSKEEVGTEW